MLQLSHAVASENILGLAACPRDQFPLRRRQLFRLAVDKPAAVQSGKFLTRAPASMIMVTGTR
jgi:hypothetical protein